MASYSIENTEKFQNAVRVFELIWIHYSEKHFPDYDPNRTIGASTAKIV